MKRKLYVILILVCVVMASAGIVVFGANQSQDVLEKNTEIEINGETNRTLTAELTGFYPGNEQAYTITLKGGYSDDYVVTLNFRDNEEKGELENYLTVTISAGENKIEKSLKELLDGEEIELGGTASEIEIAFAMPADTGNESQGTTASFYIDFTAKNR